MLTIGELSARSGVAPSALRYYERLGLIHSHRTSGNQRRYEQAQLRRVAFIRIAAQVGLSLDETALLHERLGIIVLPYDRREGTLFAEGGAWMMLLVPAAIVGPAVLWRLGLRDYLRAAPVAALRMGLGLGLFVAGAAGVELLRGVSVGAWWHPLQVLLEEGLEFLGATLILWGVLDLARALGIRVTAD